MEAQPLFLSPKFPSTIEPAAYRQCVYIVYFQGHYMGLCIVACTDTKLSEGPTY